MKHLLWSLVLVFLAAAPAWSKPNFVPLNKPPSTSGGTLVFGIGDVDDSSAIGVSGFCTVRFQQASGDDVSLYAVTTSTTAASSGTLLKSFTSSTSPSNPAYTFTASTQWVKAKATDATAGGSVMIIECNPTFGSGGGSGASCDTGNVMGGGYDTTTGLYDWTCGNYPWSASYGGTDASGVSSFSSPTTAGGNSWTLYCTGDGTASNGTAAEGSICLTNGEEIKMYAMADIMLAEDFTRPGGTVYLPDGVYHDRYCGQSASAVANGCPVLRRSPGHQTRKISMSRGIKLVGSGIDADGPHKNGRGGVWLISDHGGDTDTDDTLSDNVSDPGGYTGYLPGHWAFRVGLGAADNPSRVCVRTGGSTGCITTNAAVRDQDVEPISSIGRSTGVLGGTFTTTSAGGMPQICVDNREASGAGGVCSADPRVQCAADADCTDVGGTCVGVADAMETLVETESDAATNGSNASSGVYALIYTYSQKTYATGNGASAVNTATNQAVLAAVSGVNAGTCNSGNGRLVQLGSIEDARPFYPDSAGGSENLQYNTNVWNPMSTPFYDTSVQIDKVVFTTADKVFNYGGGIYGVNIMPGSWKGRDSTTAAADCSQNWTAAYGSACDDVDLIALGAGLGGGLYDSSVWYGGGMGSYGYAYSKIDGDQAGLNVEAKRNWFPRGYGLQSDASGWTFEDNVWEEILGSGKSDNGAQNSAIFALGFGHGFRMYRDRFINVSGAYLFHGQGADGAIIRDVEVSGGMFPGGIINLVGTRRTIFDGITGHGFRGGPVIQINPGSAMDVFDVTINNVMIDNVQKWSSTQNEPNTIVWASDNTSYNGGAAGSVAGPVRISNVFVSVHGDDAYCGLFFDGGSGAEGTAANGSGRTVDDWRHLLSFENINLERVSDGSISSTYGTNLQATCLSDESPTADTSNDPGNGLNEIYTSVGGMPRLVNLRIGGVNAPNIDQASIAVGATHGFDCQNLAHGTVVLAHDMPTASTCTDTGTDGTLNGGTADTAPSKTVRCKCDPAGDTADGAWSAF